MKTLSAKFRNIYLRYFAKLLLRNFNFVSREIKKKSTFVCTVAGAVTTLDSRAASFGCSRSRNNLNRIWFRLFCLAFIVLYRILEISLLHTKL
jgi:hypothetical protein